ncbi:T9SS type A sorting domain-containing protein [Hymenobacter sp. BT186]|uniref:T9SS type A sorting domain-containing protein n=1 Tax=Hymenobacter telluris TaxID=2816474 RepID=A0A939ERE2_9BACT|nr:LamG-like jellyroll fold domain-containing protein [Hymenobacter telluris]MBO0356384.1 T9SS type A sorting domain-containing protein [Hymenobacter telluris]MBW3372408.1 T9SS type A sorting domain-containing protein [Hymenobacter norwichensis]
MKKLYFSSAPTTSTGSCLRQLCGSALLAALLGGSLSASAQTALLFNGTTKYVQANTVTLNTTSLSMESWVKVTAFKTTFPYITSVMGVEDGNNAAMLRFGDATVSPNRMQFVLTVGATQYKVNSLATFNVNTWYHVAGTFDGTTMRLYVNGVLDNSTAAVGTAAGTGTFMLGRNYEALRTLNGSLDEARVWTRTLTAAEIAASPCQVSATAAGLEAYWRLNEGTGTVANDLTGRGHTGTLMGMTNTDWSTVIPTSCAALATASPRAASDLQVQVLGNPARGTQAEIEIRGVKNQPVTVQLLNMLGAVVSTRQVQSAAAEQRSSVPLPAAAGLYVVRVSTPAGTVATKLLKE